MPFLLDARNVGLGQEDRKFSNFNEIEPSSPTANTFV
jgi:hypothetical protein